MSYWMSDEKIPVEQKSVRIPSENGLEYIAGQEIRLRIDSNSVRFFNPKQTYLEFNVKIKLPTGTISGSTTKGNIYPTRLQLDAETGGQSLCRNIRISDGQGNELESIENYNTMVAMKYDYDTNDSMRNVRALTEGSTTHNTNHRATSGGTKSTCNTARNNPYIQDDNASTLVTNTPLSDSSFINCKCTLPLHTGIFSNDKIFPNYLLNNGMFITILLEDNNRVFRQLDTAMRYRRLDANPVLFGKTALGASIPLNGSFNEIYLETRNSQHTSVQQCPFVVGESIGFQRFIAGNASIAVFQSASGVPTIKEITVTGGKIKLELNASVELDGEGLESAYADPVYVYSTSVEDAPSYEPTYLVSDVNLICEVVEMPSGTLDTKIAAMMKEPEGMVYDFMSVTNYKHSLLASDRVANVRIPINERRSKAIFVIPTDATVYTSKQNINASDTYKINKTEAIDKPDYYLRSNRSSFEGISDFASSYVWNYDQKLQPNRPISLSKVSNSYSIDAQHLIELDKALGAIGVSNPSFQRFNQNFIIGRALAIGKNKVYDGVNKDFMLQLNYNEATSPSKQKLLMTFNYHIRRLIFSGSDVRVEI
jgi:hypothetical protein